MIPSIQKTAIIPSDVALEIMICHGEIDKNMLPANSDSPGETTQKTKKMIKEAPFLHQKSPTEAYCPRI